MFFFFKKTLTIVSTERGSQTLGFSPEFARGFGSAGPAGLGRPPFDPLQFFLHLSDVVCLGDAVVRAVAWRAPLPLRCVLDFAYLKKFKNKKKS